MNGSGGAPGEIRQFIKACTESFDGSVGVIQRKKWLIFNLPNVVNLLKRRSNSQVILFKFSSLSSLYLSIICKLYGIDYSIVPLWQVSSFLDWDNPFDKNVIPTAGNHYKNKAILRRSTFGKKTFLSYFRYFKRLIYRKTLGGFMLKFAKYVFVFSAFEKSEINKLISNNNFVYRFIRFECSIENRLIGTDKFSKSNGTLKITFWGRLDYYYKGIDKISNEILKIKDQNLNFKIYLIGPDYNESYRLINDFIKKNSLGKNLEIISDYEGGTLGYLADSDYSIVLPRWDGYVRSIKESILLGVPVIVNKETNHDKTIMELDCGYLIESDALGDLLVQLCQENNKINMQSDKAIEYFSSKACAIDFLHAFK
jgi:hypothetical protein